jgi:hypothetical protein
MIVICHPAIGNSKSYGLLIFSSKHEPVVGLQHWSCMGVGAEYSEALVGPKEGNFTHGYGYPRVPCPYGQGMGTVL